MDHLVNDLFSRSWSRATELKLPADLRAEGDDCVVQVDVLDFKPDEGQKSLGALSSQRTGLTDERRAKSAPGPEAFE
ncbi:MAG: hypothetical protein ACT4QE_12405 [Anaerolineales bacterium]